MIENDIQVQADATASVNLVTAAGGIFSEVQVDNFMQMTQEQKNEFTTHFMINMVADKGKKKA